MRRCANGSRSRGAARSIAEVGLSPGAQLPPEIRYPTVLDHGTADPGLRWSLTRRLTGQTLEWAWAGLTDDQRRGAIADLGRQLRALHEWQVPALLTAQLQQEWTAARSESEQTAFSLLGLAINPLPDHLPILIDEVESMGLAGDLLGEVRSVVRQFADLLPVLDRPDRTGLIHGDLTLGNLWWDGEAVTLLDLEWARFAPPYADLTRLFDEADDDQLAGVSAHSEALALLRDAYPRAFEVEQFEQRVRIFRIAFQIRELLIAARQDRALELSQLRRLLTA